MTMILVKSILKMNSKLYHTIMYVPMGLTGIIPFMYLTVLYHNMNIADLY